MKQQFYVVCQIYEINQCLTALHKELLCLGVSFLPVYFCLKGVESHRLRQPKLLRTMWERTKETAHVVFFFSTVEERLHLYRPFHTATSSVMAHSCTFLLRSFSLNPQLDLASVETELSVA